MCGVELNTRGCLQISTHDLRSRKQADINNSYMIKCAFLTFEADVL